MVQTRVQTSLNVATVFDSARNHPHSLLHSGSIQNTLLRLLPADSLEEETQDTAFLEHFLSVLPIFKWSEWKDSRSADTASAHVSLFLVHQHRPNAMKFFYEMISRWLSPGRRLSISSFFATDFQLPELTKELFTISEMVISFASLHELELARRHLAVVESEIKLGLISVYHANRILEIKGLASDEKTCLIQERITSLLEKRPTDFDYDIFSQMQHFLVMCGEEFKAARSFSHMTRIIYIFYLFHKKLKIDVEKQLEQRFVRVKLSQTYLHLPLGMKKVLSIFVGLNFLNDNELFEERHLIKVLETLIPVFKPVAESYFVSTFKESKMQMLYLEIEKPGGNFSLPEIRALQMKLPDEVKNGVEKWMRPVFMPRNEEEVMRNIITLAQQLRYPKDIPQVIISFDQQTEGDLSFIIILVRILTEEHNLSIQELFERGKTSLKFLPDRVKKIGRVRKRYDKEASVFHVLIPSAHFIRPDHSLDLFKARQGIVIELQRIVGEVRDYNGGMIAKQHEQFLALKELFPYPLDKREDLLLENVFHSIFPIELRSVLEPILIKTFFTLLLELRTSKKEGHLSKMDSEGAFFLYSYQDPEVKQKIAHAAAKLHLPSSQLVTISLPIFEIGYSGYILWEEEKEVQKRFLDALHRALTFEEKEVSWKSGS